MIKYIVGGLVGLVVAFVVVVAMQPSEMRVERNGLVGASPEVVYGLLDDFPSWNSWQPWHHLDTNQKLTFEGPESGVGAAYTWEGNEDVGKGRMEITEAVPGERVVWDLHFLVPFEARNVTEIKLAPEGEGTRVTWTMYGINNFAAKAAGLFMDMDATIGGAFERGLGNLDTVAKAEATRLAEVKAAEEAAAAEAAAQAAAAVPAEGAPAVE